MGNLTLILSDLYLPSDAGRGAVTQALPMPNLQWLLRFAEAAPVFNDWRSWLARDLNAGSIATRPPAHLVAAMANVTVQGSWFATPVHLVVRLDHVRLANRGLLRLSSEQAGTMSAEFSETFGPELVLNVGPDNDLLLLGGPDADIGTVDPARLLDADIGAALPAGLAAGDLRRLTTEIQMWLPGTRTNAARQRAGEKAVTGLWLWGGGVSGAEVSLAKTAVTRLYGRDAWLAALAHFISSLPAQPAPARFSELEAGAAAYVELAPMSGPQSEALNALEENWFAPARGALLRGELERFTLVANDRVFSIGARARWKFWRRQADWVERLTHSH